MRLFPVFAGCLILAGVTDGLLEAQTGVVRPVPVEERRVAAPASTMPYASQFESGRGGNGIANAFAAGRTVVFVDPGSGPDRTFAPTVLNGALHDFRLGYEGNRYRNCPYNTGTFPSLHVAVDACSWDHVTFDLPSAPYPFQYQALAFHSMNIYGKSPNFSGHWRTTAANYDLINASARGITDWNAVVLNKNSSGDMTAIDMYLNVDGGFVTPSDEADVGIRNYLVEHGSYYHGTVVSTTGTGDFIPAISESTGGSESNHTTDQAFLLDISKGVYAGKVTSATSSRVPGSKYLQTYKVAMAGRPLPLISAWGTCPAKIPYNGGSQLATSVTCTVKLHTGSFTAGGLVWIAGPNLPEQAMITSVGTAAGGEQAITLLARNENEAGAEILQSGMTGQYLSFDANLASTKLRSSYYAFGTLDGVNLIYGYFPQGNYNSLPGQYSQAFAAGVEGRNGFHLYPGAEIIGNHSVATKPELEANQVPWAPGDLIENPHRSEFLMVGYKGACTEFTPPSGARPTCMLVSVGGPGVTAGFIAKATYNLNPPSMYLGYGGMYDGPPGDYYEGYFSFGRVDISWPYHAWANIVSMGANPVGTLFALPSANILWDNPKKMLLVPAVGLTDTPAATGPMTYACFEHVGNTKVLVEKKTACDAP